MEGGDTWITVALAAISALGGGVIGRGYAGYRAVRNDAHSDTKRSKDDRREERASDIAEQISDKIIMVLTVQVDRLTNELQEMREARTKLEIELASEKTEKFKMMRRLARLGRRDDITDLGIVPPE